MTLCTELLNLVSGETPIQESSIRPASFSITPAYYCSCEYFIWSPSNWDERSVDCVSMFWLIVPILAKLYYKSPFSFKEWVLPCVPALYFSSSFLNLLGD